jgi:anti-sigma B factor antagonist
MGADAMRPDFTLDVAPSDDRMVLRARGEIDLATAPELQSRAVSLLEQGHKHVVVDLRRVSFIDSMGISALILATRRARELGARFSVILGEKSAMRALDIAGVLDMLDLVTNGTSEAGADGSGRARG